MKPLDRNISILEHIVGYCDQIEETIRRFGNDYGVFPQMRFIGMRRHCAFCKSVNWLEN